VRHGRAIVTESDKDFRPAAIFFIDSSLNKIVARDAQEQLLVKNTGYDRERRTFFDAARSIPIVNAAKMIREERSPRKWSFATSVYHRERQNQNNNAGTLR
jgi:hypothetical protein